MVPPFVAPAFTGQTSVTTVKFSDDIRRLQFIYSIRSSPVGAQIKRVIDLLLEKRQCFTPEQINEACYVDVKGNKAVFDNLKTNVKVHYDGKQFSYKPKHDVNDQNGLLSLIRDRSEGISVNELKDAYPNVMEDMQGLKASGQIWLLPNSGEVIVYPNDRRVSVKVDDDLKQLFRSIKLPCDMIDLEKYLQKNGMKPATNTAQRRAAARMGIIIPAKSKQRKKRKMEITNRTKLTNAHLPELFHYLRNKIKNLP
ncbi:hypothetical protein V2J09_020254 [Rumex salicifolius]